MKFQKTHLDGLLVIQPKVWADTRGAFFEYYRQDLFAANGIRDRFVQSNQSVSKKGVLRGLHYQVAPHWQAKLVRVVLGSAFDVAVDLRPSSKTFGKCFSIVLSAANNYSLYIPKGFAHGFLALENNTHFLYKVSSFYSATDERGIRWDDPDLKIKWPKMTKAYALSEKDKQFSFFREVFSAR